MVPIGDFISVLKLAKQAQEESIMTFSQQMSFDKHSNGFMHLNLLKVPGKRIISV